MRYTVRLLCILLALPALVWGQAAQVINGNRVHAGWVNYGTTSGTATAYTLTFTPALPGYVTGQCFLFKPHITNTGAATLNVQGKGALSLTKLSGGTLGPLVAGDLLLNRLVMACHDGTNLQLMGAAPDASPGGVTDGDKQDITVSASGTVWTIDPASVTYTKLQNTAAPSVLLGRGSAAGAGALQEITLGTNLSMSGTTLNAAGAGGVADGDKGDITASASGATWTIDADTVTYAKLQNTAAASVLLGRGSAAGAGDPQEITLGTNLTMSGTQLNASATAATAFSALTGGTNSTAAMVVGTGASLGVTGTGTITATALATNPPACGANLFATDIAANGTLACTQPTFANLSGIALAAQLPNADDDGTTKGIAAFAAADFECTTGVCALDYANGQAASSTTKGFLTSGDWSLFNTKQNALGYTAENTANKKADAVLGTSNDFYPTQGAVKTYVDSGVKVLTNTALTPRPCTGADTATVTMNADNLTGCDFVQVAQLSQTTNFDLTAGTYVNGQFLTVLIFTTTQRALTWTAGAGKFAAEGIPLPTFTRGGGYVLYGFRYNGHSNRWTLVASNQQTNYGTAGHVLTSGGPGVEPAWQPPTGGGGTIGERLLPITGVDFPATNPALLARDTNGTAVLRFDNNVAQCVSWGPFRMNVDYASTPVFKFQYSMESVTVGNVSIQVSIMAITPGVDAENPDNDANYAVNPVCGNPAVPGTARTPNEISCPLTSTDGLLARDLVKIRLCRNAPADTADGIMFGLAAALEYTK